MKNAAKRPGTKEGGREEEKSRLGIAIRQAGRLRSKKGFLDLLLLHLCP
jgi:hypothetical protein